MYFTIFSFCLYCKRFKAKTLWTANIFRNWDLNVSHLAIISVQIYWLPTVHHGCEIIARCCTGLLNNPVESFWIELPTYDLHSWLCTINMRELKRAVKSPIVVKILFHMHYYGCVVLWLSYSELISSVTYLKSHTHMGRKVTVTGSTLNSVTV